MTKYAFPASFLLVTLCLAMMAALAVGAFPLGGATPPVLSIHEVLHSVLVRPLGRPIATGLVLFAGLWPTFWFFNKARKPASTRDDAGANVTANDRDSRAEDLRFDESEETAAEPVERSATSVLDRIAARRSVTGVDAELVDSGSEPPSDGPDEDPEEDPEEGSGREDAIVPTVEIEAEGEPQAETEVEDALNAERDSSDTDLSDAVDAPDEPEADDAPSDEREIDETDETDSPFAIDHAFPVDDIEPDPGEPFLTPPPQPEPIDAFDATGNEDGGDHEAEEGGLLVKKKVSPREDGQAGGFASLADITRPGGQSFLPEDDEEDDEDEESGPSERPDWLFAIERQAVVLRQQVPPPSSPGYSFYGGVPIVPPGFEWPRLKPKAGGKPLHFLLQVDLGQVPAEARLDMLPESGVLYAFLDLVEGSPNGYRIVHAEGPVENWEPAEIPEDLEAVYGDEGRYAWPWFAPETCDATKLPRLLPMWFFEPVLARLPEASPYDREGGHGPRWWPDCDAVSDELARVQGNEVLADQTKPIAEDGTLVRPFAAFPHDWRAIAITSAQILEELLKPSFAEICRQRGMSDADGRMARAQWKKQAEECLAWAESHDPVARVPQDESDMFWDWLCGLEGVNYLVSARSAKHSIEATLSASPEAADLFDDDALALVRERHALAVLTEDGLTVPTPNRMLAPPSYMQGALEEIAAKEVLLLEVAADEAIGQLFGEGVYQFTIAPEDLKEKRFDKVRLTLSHC